MEQNVPRPSMKSREDSIRRRQERKENFEKDKEAYLAQRNYARTAKRNEQQPKEVKSEQQQRQPTRRSDQGSDKNRLDDDS